MNSGATMNETLSFLSWISDLLSNDDFLMPFYATVGASITLLLLQFVSRWVTDKRKKLYAAAYILDVCHRVQSSAFILLRHTILPHIEATKQILKGDKKLLETTFMADEFDILTAGPVGFTHLSEEYKVLLGYDDIELIQMFEAVNYLSLNDANRLNLNSFVKENLKSRHKFSSLSDDEQNDILNTYWDYLGSIEHEENRLIAFISAVVIPRMRSYTKELQFLLFSTRASKAILTKLETDQTEYSDLIPGPDFFQRSKTGGIQRFL